jgi:hypothetical protein
MNGVDPMADKYSSLTPYNFSFNDPVTFTDANGADPWWQRYTDMHGGMLDGFHNAVVDGGGGGGGDPFMNSGYRFAYGRNGDFGNRRGSYDDAEQVMRGRMSHQEYGFKYGDKNYWVVYRENENTDGSISGGFYLYHYRTFWQDAPNDFSSTRIPLAFAVYKNGAGSEYWAKRTWDLNGDGRFQKNEADNWWLIAGGDVWVDNSKINWDGLTIPDGQSTGNFAISTTDAFRKLTFETAATYGGTSFKIIGPSQVEVIDQRYHYDYRPNNSWENRGRNLITWLGRPPGQGTDFMIHYYNPIIWIK